MCGASKGDAVVRAEHKVGIAARPGELFKAGLHPKEESLAVTKVVSIELPRLRDKGAEDAALRVFPWAVVGGCGRLWAIACGSRAVRLWAATAHGAVV